MKAPLLKNLTTNEKVLLSFFAYPLTITVGGEHAENQLTHWAAINMLSLISRGYIVAESVNDTGRVRYSLSSDELRDQVRTISMTFMNKHGKGKTMVTNEKVE